MLVRVQQSSCGHTVMLGRINVIFKCLQAQIAATLLQINACLIAGLMMLIHLLPAGKEGGGNCCVRGKAHDLRSQDTWSRLYVWSRYILSFGRPTHQED